MNLDLQSNTWHNLTYAYQGEGSSRVTYLDGRKVAEDQAEDTFGEYPPFAMTGYAQGGYVVSASSSYSEGSYPGWNVFNNIWHNNGDTDGSEVWLSENAENFSGTDGLYNRSPPNNLGTGAFDGEWVKIEIPHKFKLDYITIYPRLLHSNRAPRDFIVYGSNDNINWSPVLTETGASITSSHQETGHTFSVDAHDTCYKYFGLVTRKLRTATNFVGIAELKFYGHRENDLVRLPDPTNVLKYPHIAMTGPAQRGYVVTESSYAQYNINLGFGWKAFDSTRSSSSSEFSWQTVSSTYSSGNARTGVAIETIPENSNTHVGSWVTLETPHKIQVSSVELTCPVGIDEYRPNSVVILGGDNNSTWNFLKGDISSTYTNDIRTITITSSVAYKYHMLLVKTTGSASAGYATTTFLSDIRYYGTEEGSVPIQIGGGNIDKVANFRVYDTFVGEDQALEIWDAQKDYFGRAKSSMTLQKGRLGLGTTEPQGRLAVLDEPHNLEEFPPRAMTAYKNYFEGHGVFCVSASSEYTNTPRLAWKAFNKSSENIEDGWMNSNHYTGVSSGTASGTTPTFTGSITLAGIAGEWISLEFPYKVKLNGFKITSSHDSTFRGLNDGFLLGRNDKNSEYSNIMSVTESNVVTTSETPQDGYTENATGLRTLFHTTLGML